MFVDVLFSFQRTSHHLVLATLLVYHVQLLLSNIFLFFSKLFIVSFNPSFLMTLLVYHACRLLSNSFSTIFQQDFLQLRSKNKKIKNTHRVSSFQLERVKRIELSQSAWKAEVLPLNYTRSSYEMAQRRPTLALAYYPRR